MNVTWGGIVFISVLMLCFKYVLIIMCYLQGGSVPGGQNYRKRKDNHFNYIGYTACSIFFSTSLKTKGVYFKKI